MAELIILRLHPAEPMSGSDFTSLLQGLTIDAFDLTFGDSVQGVKIGGASGLANPHPGSTTNNNVSISSTSILQHYIDVPIITPTSRELEAAATAVIVVNAPAGHPEYPDATSFDIRLEIKRGGLNIVGSGLHYNVTVQKVSTSLSKDQKDYFNMAASAYVTLPGKGVGQDPTIAFVDLPADGRPPRFDELVKAIDLVLAKDPGGANADLAHLAPLSAARSRQVAAEIVWNRTLHPEPAPPQSTMFPPPTPPSSLGEMYTRPPVDSAVNAQDAEIHRKQFEAELTAYNAIHDAGAQRLASFVFAASAAVACERLSATAENAGFTFPLITGASTGANISAATVTLSGKPLNPAFIVPAAYFYALGAALPTQVSAQQRYDMVRIEAEERLLKEFQTAVDVGAIATPAKPVTTSIPPTAVNPDQAARRLRALGVAISPAPKIPLAPPVATLVSGWLAHAGPSANIDAAFWATEVTAQPAAYLELVLHGVTGSHQPLINAIKGAPHNVTTVAGLVAITDKQWRDFFLAAPPAVPAPPGAPPRMALLPPFTQPGTPTERVEAFIRHLRKFFTVPFAQPGVLAPGLNAPPTIGLSIADVFGAFTSAYAIHAGGAFKFGDPLNAGALQQAIADVFPGDAEAQGWLKQALETLDALFRMTDLGSAFKEIQFSLMEALYARGFTDAKSVQALSQADFQEAMTGSVAYPHAPAVWVKSGAVGPAPLPAKGGFEPINPDGLLTDCIPPLHLSPLGPVEYLAEMLRTSAASTCGEPFLHSRMGNLGAVLAGRRGPLGNLHATRANLATPLPMIDLVNESLEALTEGLPTATGGAVYDTAGDELAGHKLNHAAGAAAGEPFLHDPQTLFAALPEHSSPAAPVKKSGGYAKLKVDFTSPVLPYTQSLDICRTYLGHLRASRYAVMRRFRKDITEFVIDPANEPADFQRHLWRYPARIEIAREYLGISPEEHDLLYSKNIGASGGLVLHEMFGFPSAVVNRKPWSDIVIKLPEFLRGAGLTYCEFIELWRAKFVEFKRAGEDQEFPDCEPCCLDNLVIEFVTPGAQIEALKRLAVFIRLWRTLRNVKGAMYSFVELRDICEVLELFHSDGTINRDFIRQLAAFQILRDHFALALTDKDDSQPGVGADRTHLLALWGGPSARKWAWAVDELLDLIQRYAKARHNCGCRPPEFIKLLGENLDPLSGLIGFDPGRAADSWHAQPTHTLRFAEVLAKLYASDFGIGEALFLFTVDDHLDGDDPFPLQPNNEALDSPLGLPDDEDQYSLWTLRRKLLAVEAPDEEARSWTWLQIEALLREEFGFAPTATDSLRSIGERFFPKILEASGYPVDPLKQQYRVGLGATSAAMWNTPPDGPFHYDSGAQKLWTRLPLTDEAVIAKLSRIRQLNPDEQAAVRELYFSPRVDLAPFAFIFTSFGEAEEALIQEADEQKRWAYFQREFALCHARCRVIAQHLAQHIAGTTGQDRGEGAGLAWRLLRNLFADENMAKAPWESDTGALPPVTWSPQPNGGAFAALLGLTGTGLLGEFLPLDEKHKLIWEDDRLVWEKADFVWREVRGPMDAFGPEENSWNKPVPTVVPDLGLTLSQNQLRFVDMRNGFAMANADGAMLGCAQGFAVRWTGALLVENEGTYEFRAGAPTPDGEAPDFEAAEDRRWRVTLKRGQKTWFVLSHKWPDVNAPAACSAPQSLKRGAYQIIVEFIQPHPPFSPPEETCPQTTGFQLKYSGPDSSCRLVAIPIDKLFRNRKDETLDSRIKPPLIGADADFLKLHFTSTLRDIRRTYQRAFKSLLFAHRFGLSAKPIADDGQSEIDYLLAHFDDFAGVSYFRNPPTSSSFAIHQAHFDFNFLPILDNYLPPAVAQDQRVQPTVKRRQALFDWWERVFDYTSMRRETQTAPERPVWLLFHEAAEKHPDDPTHLLRHMGVDITHAPLVLRYFDGFSVSSADLEDERWAVRAWQAEKWIRALLLGFFAKDIREARPDLWASDDPNVVLPSEAQSGNQNLTRFVRAGCFENGEPRRYEDVALINNDLRQRARAAMLAYLCGIDRVTLPWGGHARTPRDLSDLLLQDVEVGICQRASRIEEAISAVQTFVQRARLGLEPGFAISPAFALLWDKHFETFVIWEICKRREIYRENWIDWDELEKARKTEAFRFLESELRRSTLTVPIPGGLEYWSGPRPPAYPGLTVLQSREPAEIQFLRPGPMREGLDLLGAPERDARPSWLAPVHPAARGGADGGRNGGDEREPNVNGPAAVPDAAVPAVMPTEEITNLPLWIQAAIRLGTRFIRVAAAGAPPASTTFSPRSAKEAGCCVECGRVHPPAIDEYYFWLQDSRYFNEVEQNADLGAESPDNPLNDTTSDWRREEKLPMLLHWDSRPMVHLFWRRVHNGEFKQARRSDEGLRIDPTFTASGQVPQLNFMGRTADSLRFEVTGGKAPAGFGDQTLPSFDPTPPGFRYDMATDSAVTLPLIVAPQAPAPIGFPAPLLAYPFIVYFAPGAHLQPPSLFSVALAVAGTLRAHCRFEAALKWYELAFNPLNRDITWAQCPPAIPPPLNDGSGDGPGANPNNPSDSRSDANSGDAGAPRSIVTHTDRGGDLPCCPSEPVSDEIARDRAIVLHYLETLLRWGDALMCRNSPEAFQQATVIFNTLEKVLGAHPITVFAEDESADPVTVAAFIARPAPLNPRLMGLYGRSADRLALIHHCLNNHRLRNGRPNIDMPYWGNSPLREGWRTTTHICQDDDDWCLSCCSAYRFVFLLQKALELAGDVRSLGAALLAAYEKGDAEYLASLRSTHERQLLHLTLEIRQNQWREADWQVQALRKTKEGAQTRKRYFEKLISVGLNAGETTYVALTGVSIASRVIGNISEAIAQGIGMTPDIWFGVAGFAGTPLFFQQLPIGNKLAANFTTAARILSQLAEIANSSGSLSLTQGGWDRREDEWRHQVEVIGIEIEQIERQILAAERRRDIALRELNNHQRQIENSTELQNFLRDKFTSHELYLFLQQETAALHYQAYELALHATRKAQKAFNYERGHTARTFLPDAAWDNLHEGLMAGERLHMALRHMERAYLDANCREYELTKHISFRLHFPFAFLHLKTTGYCEIEIPEWMFDLEYPGHYMRRIKNVTLTIPCIVGPYTGVHCRLTLLSSMTRVDQRLNDPAARCCGEPKLGMRLPDDCCSDSLGLITAMESERLQESYLARPDDPRIVKTYAATEAIATSSGQNDSGMFELNFRDERYLPFEFAGAVSRWRIELPPENNFFDMESLSDVVLHLNYTAREGGEILRCAANEVAQKSLSDTGVRLFDVRHDFPIAWQQFQVSSDNEGSHHQSRSSHGKAQQVCAGSSVSPSYLGLRLSRNMFPYLPCHRDVMINRLELLFEAPGAAPSGRHLVQFLANGKGGHVDEDAWRCDAEDVPCVASAEWPCLYHGVLDVKLGPLSASGQCDFGTFRFPPGLSGVSRLFLICSYEIGLCFTIDAAWRSNNECKA